MLATGLPWQLRFIAVVVIAAISIGASLPGSGDKDTASPGSDSTSKPAGGGGKKEAGLNQAVRDGKFEFTVTKVECGKSQVGTKDFGKQAQGQFYFIYVTVKNIGNEPQSLFGDNQYLFDAKNQRSSADTEAAMWLAEQDSTRRSTPATR